MASAVSHFKPYTQPHDVTCKDVWVVTSPNVDFVPEPYIFEDEDLQPCADGCFGLVDCSQWPQLYNKEYQYSICIPQKDSIHSLAVAWYDLTQDNFIAPTGPKSVVGTLQDAKVKEFEQLLWLLCNRHHHLQGQTAAKEILSVQMSSAQNEVMCLWHHPLVFRDLVIFIVQLQHTLLDIHALLDYIKILHPLLTSPSSKPLSVNLTWMGCFMKDTEVCEGLYFTGVPVWLVHHEDFIPKTMNIIHPVWLTFSDNIVRAMYSENGVVKLFLVIYCGPSGIYCHYHTHRHYEGTLAEQPKPIAGSVGAKAKGEKANPLDIPDPHSLFKSTWKKVDKNLQQCKSGFVDPGYCFLKPSLFVGAVNGHLPSKFLTPQMWRDFLNTIDTSQLSLTRSRSSKSAVLDILGENIVQVAAKSLAEAWEEIIRVSSLSDPPLWLVHSILWELYKLNFHYELYVLNCIIVPEHWTTSEACTWQTLLHSVFPGGSGLGMWLEPLPWEPHELGMCTCSIEVALTYVNNFCELLSAWPGAPSHLQSPAEMNGQDNSGCYKLFLTACQFYLQTAFDFLRQQPSLLHVFSFI
ncbi:hypothetical protein V8B97DRAFT_2022084 [Scleroderma yunnanense]